VKEKGNRKIGEGATILIDVQFVSNTAASRGRAVAASSAILTDAVFINHTTNFGAGLRTYSAALLIATLDARETGNDRRAILEKLTGGTGKPPYGYKFIKLSPLVKGYDGLEVYDPEAAIVRQIYRLYLNGDGNGVEPLTFHAIALRLSTEGIPAPSESQRKPNQQCVPGIWDGPLYPALSKVPFTKVRRSMGNMALTTKGWGVPNVRTAK